MTPAPRRPAPRAPAPPRAGRARSLVLAGVALLAVVPYLAGGLLHNPLIIDAPRAIGENAVVQAGTLRDIARTDFWGVPVEAAHGTRSYRPIVTATYAVEARLFRNAPWAYHGFDLALHALAALLAAGVAAALRPASRWAAAAGAVVAVHPVATEAVCSAVGRADLIAACAFLGALLLHLRAPRSPSPWSHEAGALALLAVALLAKEYAVAFPPALAAIDGLLAAAGRIGHAERTRRTVTLGLGLLLLAGYLLLRWRLFGALGGVPMLGAADHPLYGAPLGTRLWTAGALVLLGARLLVLPFGLNYFYGEGTVALARTVADARVLLALLLLAAAAALAVRRLARRSDPVPAVALAIGLLALAPALNVVSLGGVLFAERFLYLPLAALALAVAAGLAALPARRRVQRAAAAALLVALAAGGVATARRTADWSSTERLVRDSLAQAPHVPLAWFELGLALGAEGRHAEAAQAFERAIALRGDRPAAWKNYAVALGRTGRDGEAVVAWRRALALSPDDLVPLWRGLGMAELRAGHPAEAVRALQRVLDLAPDDLNAQAEMGRALVLLAQERLAAGRPGEALGAARRAADLPRLPAEGLLQAGLVASGAGAPDEAAALFRRALRDDPSLLRKRHALAVELDDRGQHGPATTLFRQVRIAERALRKTGDRHPVSDLPQDGPSSGSNPTK